ncbi:MAG: hypothetical protein K5979_14445 [Ruminococcus sp.]|nr:hypothetical protein [Ruminococcus sp.]
MGNSQYLIDEKEQVYRQPQEFPNKFFSEFFKAKISIILDENGEVANKKTIAKEKELIADQLGIDYESFKKFINEQKQIKKRDLVIAICVLIKANSTETDEVLDFFKMPELEPSWDEIESRDDVLIDILDSKCEKPYSVAEINKKLTDKHYNNLDIIDHKKKDSLRKEYPYPLIKKKIECRVDELIYGDQYNSLSTEYDINRYHIIARMWLGIYKEDYYELHTENEGIFYLKKNTDILFEQYKKLEDTGKFKDCFIELSKMVEIEKKRMAKILNDTKNYKCRRSARVIENELHVFYETYNYSIPELCEYYLMDYVNGEYTLYVSKNSMFMRFYLTDQEYVNIYGKSLNRNKYLENIKQYRSIESMEKKLESDKNYRYHFLKRRISAFKTIKLEIDSLIEKLTTGKVHILNLEYVFDNPCDIFKYYDVTEEFQCVYDDEYGEISNGIDKATFSIDDKQDIELTFENLIDRFELGLGSIDEIGKFLLQHKSLKIADCIANGTI